MTRFIVAVCFGMLCLFPGTTELAAQQPARVLPNDGYYRTFNDFYQGEYSRALKNFRSSARGGYISVNGPWIDAVCYHAMIGECALNVGEIEVALEQYNTAIKVYATNAGWGSRAEIADTLRPDSSAANRARINWGTTSRDTQVGDYPNSISIMVGNLDGIERGGVVQRPELRPVNIIEVMRCLSLSLRRRNEILGSAASYDGVTREAVDALNASGLAGGHWARPWVDVPLAIGMIGEGNAERAAILLQNSIQIRGEYDHPLSGIALLELGKLYFKAERYDDAAQLFYEATLTAAVFGQQDVIEEAFYWATNTHLVQKKGGEYPPLANALAWAQRDGSKQLIASLAIQLAECRLAGGDNAAASSYLAPVARTMRGNEIGKSPIGARYSFQLAHAAFQQGNVNQGLTNLATSMQLQKLHSRWLLHIGLADQLYVANSIPARTAGAMFDNLLREPTAKDWQRSPMEAMSVLLIPHPVPMEHWFEMAFAQGDHEKAIEISDRIRRQRFYNSQPLGGRVLALRWVLEAPREAISQAALQQRQEFFLRYPDYAELSSASKTAIDQLKELPLRPEDDADERVQQKKLFEDLQQIASVQEAMLADVSMRREPSEFEFPPLRPTAAIQQGLRPKQMLISYFSTSNSLYAFRLTNANYAMNRIERPQTIRSDITKMLRALGNMDRNQPLDPEIFADESWREPALRLADTLFPRLEDAAWNEVEELVVVPDGVLWYLPFEILQVGDETEAESLIEKVNIRYLPTVALAGPDARRNPAKGTLAVVTGKLYPRDDEIVAEEAFASIQSDTPDAVQLKLTLPGPASLLSVLIDRLLVLDDFEEPRGGTTAHVPMQLDQGKAGSGLGSWMSLPFGSVGQLALPGFHTAAETSLRQRGADGSDVFQIVCSMMASGTRTALISRWRPGGQNSMELMREFVRELPAESATKAWRRSIDLAWRGDIIPEMEPRIKETKDEAEISPKHPFFWAAYMLIDTGVVPVKD